MNNYLELKSSLHSLFDDESIDNNPFFLDRINLLSKKENIKNLILIMLDSNEILNNIAKSSYSHNNGFDKLVLVNSTSPSYKLRLHIWWPNEFPTDSNVHNHRWNFYSSIITGKLNFQIFDNSVNGIEGLIFDQYKYSSPGNADTFTLKNLGQKYLVCKDEYSLTTNSSYYLTNKELHRVSSEPNLLSASLVLQTSIKANSTDVFVQKNTNNIATKIRRMSANEVKKKLRRLSEKI